MVGISWINRPGPGPSSEIGRASSLSFTGSGVAGASAPASRRMVTLSLCGENRSLIPSSGTGPR